MAIERRPLEKYVAENLEELFNSISISPDENGKAGNLDAYFFETSLTANTSKDIYHKLGRVPNGFLNVYQSQFGSIRTLSLGKDKITIRCDADTYLKGIII